MPLDVFRIVGIPLLAYTLYGYHRLIRSHYKKFVDYQLQILTLRVATVIPLFAVLEYVTIIWPEYFPIFETVESFVEAYCIYCYFALLVMYCGGKERVMMLMRETEAGGCQSCTRDTPDCCYETINLLLLQFVVVRPILNLLYALTEMNGKENVTLRTLMTISLVIAMIGLLRIYKILRPHTQAMDATSKVLVIKALILLLVLQDLAVQSLYSAGVFNTEYGLDEYDAEDKARRVYAFVALCECAVGIVLVQKYFKAETLRSPLLHDIESDIPETNLSGGTYKYFVMDLLSFWHVFHYPPDFGAAAQSQPEMKMSLKQNLYA